MKKIKVGVIGATGYAGAELVRLLSLHPNAEIAAVSSVSFAGKKLSEVYPAFYGKCDLTLTDGEGMENICDVIFASLPHGLSEEKAEKCFKAGKNFIDLGADFRLDSAEEYEKWYKKEYKLPYLHKESVYCIPELHRDRLKGASIVGNPGCYPTATLLALLPFLPYVEGEIFVDAKSGVSGAGKKLTDDTHYPTINENIFSYAPLTHRHQIEIEEKCAQFGAVSARVHFVPHLCPFTRGMLVSVFATLREEYADIEPLEILERAYEGAPFVRICTQSVRVSDVRGSNMCDVFALKRGRALYINSAIDNLMRGASSQAVVNANIMCGLPQDCGIPQVGW